MHPLRGSRSLWSKLFDSKSLKRDKRTSKQLALRGLFVGRATDPVTSSLDTIVKGRYDYSMCTWFTNQGHSGST